MLQFFKKAAGHREKPKSSHSSPVKSPSTEESIQDGFVGASLVSIPASICSFEEEEKDDGFEDTKSQVQSFHSRLSKKLPEILSDKSALGYFIQFMESKKDIGLIKFWLEMECLCGAYNQSCLENSNDTCRKTSDSDIVDKCACSILSNSVSDLELDVLSLDNSVNNNDQSLSSIDEVESNFNYPKNSSIVSDDIKQNCKCKGSSLYQDALRIHKRYLTKDEFGPNRIPENLKENLEKAITDGNTEHVVNCLSNIQKVVYKILENEYINDFLRSDFHCKHQIDVLTSGDVQLSDVLYDETAFFYFMEFMEIENKRELLDFWMTAVNYKQTLFEKGDSAYYDETLTDALIIYDKYFSLQATMPLGFTDKIRFLVEQNICREDGKGPQPDCFNRPCQIVYNYLNKNYFPTFLQSQLFYKYLSEMINSVQSSQYSHFQPPIRRAGSDCSSEISSISSATVGNNISNTEKKKLKYSSSVNGGMSIDTKQLYDPDSLWKRNRSSLSVGYVDNLGRFVTEIDPDPWRKSEKSRLSRAVKKLVHIEQDEVKEESAWKIAEMIVRDVTSLTLGNSELPH